jgi:hypothetical protein
MIADATLKNGADRGNGNSNGNRRAESQQAQTDGDEPVRMSSATARRRQLAVRVRREHDRTCLMESVDWYTHAAIARSRRIATGVDVAGKRLFRAAAFLEAR